MKFEKLNMCNIDKPDRKMLGHDIPVTLFRLIRIIGIGKLLGDSSGIALYTVGKSIGEELEIQTIAGFLKTIEDIKIGIPEVTVMSPRKIVVQLVECVTCSGLPPIGGHICYFEAGFIAGALSRILSRDTKTREVKCCANGDKLCEFETFLL